MYAVAATGMMQKADYTEKHNNSAGYSHEYPVFFYFD